MAVSSDKYPRVDARPAPLRFVLQQGRVEMGSRKSPASNSRPRRWSSSPLRGSRRMSSFTVRCAKKRAKNHEFYCKSVMYLLQSLYPVQGFSGSRLNGVGKNRIFWGSMVRTLLCQNEDTHPRGRLDKKRKNAGWSLQNAHTVENRSRIAPQKNPSYFPPQEKKYNARGYFCSLQGYVQGGGMEPKDHPWSW